MIPSIADADIANIIRTYTGHDVTSWTWTPVGFTPVNPSTGGLYRLTGDGWSLIMKVLLETQDSPDIPEHWNYWKREALAYASGIPQRLPAGMTTPKYAGVIPDQGRLYLFMEDVHDEITTEWTITDDAAVAEHLGQWAATALSEPVDAPWLCPAWLRGAMQVGTFINQNVLDTYHIWERPDIAREFPPATVRRIRQITQDAGRLHATLESLPRVLCHFDAHRANIMRRPDEFVLIDWASVGMGAAGEDIGHLFAVNVLSGFVPPEQADAHAEALIAGYARGLNADEQTVRTGFTIAAVLRAFGFFLPMILASVADPAHPERMAALPGVAAATRALLRYV